MMIVLVALLALCLFIAFKYAALRKELFDLDRQLRLIEKGSGIELTLSGREREFVKVCQRLNHIFQKYQQQQAWYRHSQEMLKQSIANISHDIRTPLTGVMGYLQMLKETEDSQKQERYLAIMESRLTELNRLLEELFLYTKLIHPEFTLECTCIPVFPVLCTSMAGAYYELQQRKIEPVINFDNESIALSASSDALERVFNNLIRNACQHGGDRLEIIQKENCICFGNSLPEDCTLDTRQMFDRFYQADDGKSAGSSGLGLAIVRQLTERMGGTVTARSADHWLSIELTLPYK